MALKYLPLESMDLIVQAINQFFQCPTETSPFYQSLFVIHVGSYNCYGFSLHQKLDITWQLD